MTVKAWPPGLNEVDILWHPVNTAISGGPSLTGSEQVIASPAIRWHAKVTLDAYGKSEETREGAVLALRALRSRLRGRGGEVLLPVFDGYRPRGSDFKMLNDQRLVPVGGVYFWEHWGLRPTEATHAVLSTGAALFATEITVQILNGPGLRPGHRFGIGERMYEVAEVFRDVGGGPQRVHFIPPLRTAASAGTRVILDRPVCTMRLASDDTGKWEEQMREWAKTSIEFDEAF